MGCSCRRCPSTLGLQSIFRFKRTSLSCILTWTTDDHRVLVEPSCGASLAAVYEPEVMKAAFKDKYVNTFSNVVNALCRPIQSTDNVVVVVCGGAGITLNMLSELDEVVKAKSS